MFVQRTTLPHYNAVTKPDDCNKFVATHMVKNFFVGSGLDETTLVVLNKNHLRPRWHLDGQERISAHRLHRHSGDANRWSGNG